MKWGHLAALHTKSGHGGKEPLLPPRTTPQDDYGAANGDKKIDFRFISL